VIGAHDVGRAAEGRGAVRIALIGDFELSIGHVLVRLSGATERFLSFLALQEVPVLRMAVAEALWPDADDERARTNVRSLLWRLGREGAAIVNGGGSRLELKPEVCVDVREAEHLMFPCLDRSLTDAGAETRRLLLNDLLPDRSEDWLVVEQERYRQLRLHAIEEVAARYLEQGRFAEAIEIMSHAISAEPLRETAHRCFLRALIAEGNRGEAYRRYSAFHDLFVEELSIEPSFSLEDLETPVTSSALP
jgi:DNA-binding SARP family transcriptional activator